MYLRSLSWVVTLFLLRSSIIVGLYRSVCARSTSQSLTWAPRSFSILRGYNHHFPSYPSVHVRLAMGTSETAEIDDNLGTSESVLTFTPGAMKQIEFLQSKHEHEMVLRMGVRAGGCSGMTYVMDFIEKADVTDDDHVEAYGGVEYAIDPKSLMFLYGMELDYSNELIGGGFKFQNPNAETSCGCGKSFGV